MTAKWFRRLPTSGAVKRSAETIHAPAEAVKNIKNAAESESEKMIYDDISNASTYKFGPAFVKAIDFIRSLNADTPPGQCSIDGDRITANVMTYDTADTVPDRLEVHRKYVDIQAVICGNEALYACSCGGLSIHTSYNEKNDCGFLVPSAGKALTKLDLVPGNFAVFFPQDAHMGKGAGKSGAQSIKKVVVKIAVDLF